MLKKLKDIRLKRLERKLKKGLDLDPYIEYCLVPLEKVKLIEASRRTLWAMLDLSASKEDQYSVVTKLTRSPDFLKVSSTLYEVANKRYKTIK